MHCPQLGGDTPVRGPRDTRGTLRQGGQLLMNSHQLQLGTDAREQGKGAQH